MQWCARFVVVVLACACDSGTPRVPVAMPAHVDATMTVQDRRAAALERVRTKLMTTKRERSSVEAPVELTFAYVDLELAYGFAKLGKTARARELVAGAKTSLGSAATDDVHAMLVALYEARIAQASAGRAQPTRLPLELETRLASLGRIVRYKVDRLRGGSTVLESAHRIDAIGGYVTKQGEDLVGATLGLADEERVNALVKVVDRASASPTPQLVQLVGQSLDALATLPTATPVLDRAIEVIGNLPVQQRANLAARALLAAAMIGDRKVVPTLLPMLGAIGGPEAGTAVVAVVRGLRILDMRAELATLLATVEPNVANDPIAYLAVAGGWFAAGKLDRATRVIGTVAPGFAQPMIGSKRLELVDALAFAYSNTSLESAEPGLAVILAQFPDVTDSYGTNSHYCMSVVQVADTLVIGLTGL